MGQRIGCNRGIWRNLHFDAMGMKIAAGDGPSKVAAQLAGGEPDGLEQRAGGHQCSNTYIVIECTIFIREMNDKGRIADDFEAPGLHVVAAWRPAGVFKDLFNGARLEGRAPHPEVARLSMFLARRVIA